MLFDSFSSLIVRFDVFVFDFFLIYDGCSHKVILVVGCGTHTDTCWLILR